MSWVETRGHRDICFKQARDRTVCFCRDRGIVNNVASSANAAVGLSYLRFFNKSAAPGTVPSADAVAAMMKYNAALNEAGVLIALDGLHPPSVGARVSFATGKPVVTDGPFTEAKEVLGGYWMIKVNSREEAIAWAKRCPASENEIIEIRQVQEMSDFPADVQEAAAGFTELQGKSGR